jgi:hypothetical protein
MMEKVGRGIPLCGGDVVHVRIRVDVTEKQCKKTSSRYHVPSPYRVKDVEAGVVD